ncbi:MAG: hypothetical protein RLZZ262_2012 [Bacteroidota bacterium]
MRILHVLLLVAFSLGIAQVSSAQRKRDKKQEAASQTPESAEAKEKADHERKLGEYRNSKKHHESIQDEATRKRMKKNKKKAERHSWGKTAPWYKRWFRRDKFKS